MTRDTAPGAAPGPAGTPAAGSVACGPLLALFIFALTILGVCGLLGPFLQLVAFAFAAFAFVIVVGYAFVSTFVWSDTGRGDG